ncbi:pseudouridine synthase [Mesorhizobium sp. CN5-321]|uniref:pseudouridine synthase n=1 Tax=Mesorhizobium hunchu TaxID=3157708 RepID=UPI0032B82850
MNDDNNKKPPRRNGGKPTGARGGFGAGKGGKPAGGKAKFGKPRGPAAEGARHGKPFEKRGFKPREETDARPRRDFQRSDRPRDNRTGEPGADGASREKRPFRKEAAGDRPFRKKPDSGTYRARDDRPSGKREFKPRDRGEFKPRDRTEFKPRDQGNGKSFTEGEGKERTYRSGRVERSASHDGARTTGRPRFEKHDGGARPDRKPFVKRERMDAAPSQEGRRFDRPKRDFPDRKPFVRRDREEASPAGTKRFDRPKSDFSDRKPSGGGFKPRPRADDAPQEGERIAKRLARAGIASRRDAEELIAAGRVKVNGKVLDTPAFNVSASDVIHLDDTEIPAAERTRLFLFHKPAGVVTTNRDPEGRKTVFEVLPAELPRLMTVGRLDINTEGLLLLTNDGGLSRVLELPSTGWLRRYRVRVHGKVEEKALADLANGIAVDGVFYGAVEASLERTQGTNAWLTIGLREGKNREVKNILGALGLEVTRLIRISYGPFQLGELPEGHVLEIKGRTLRDQLGERLIEEAGANFEADIATPFSNRPVRRFEPRTEQGDRPKPPRRERQPIGEGGLIKARKRRENSRDEALGKLSTRPDRERFGDKPGFGGKSGFGEKREGRAGRESRPIDPPGQRRANVWMAPGARPQGEKAKDKESGSNTDRSSRPRSGGDRPRPRPGKPKKP